MCDIRHQRCLLCKLINSLIENLIKERLAPSEVDKHCDPCTDHVHHFLVPYLVDWVDPDVPLLDISR